MRRKKVLIAPLDWGLGHATRCIPVVRAFLAAGADVVLAAEKHSAILLQAEFPQLQLLQLSGYEVSYSTNPRFFFLKMLQQSFKIRRAVKKEYRWLQKTVVENDIDIVISDNRFGLHTKNAHCIFITHQLFIATGNRFTEQVAQKINYRYINRFDECWIPDHEGAENLAGKLSHPAIMPAVPVKYIGPLSRFGKKNTEENVDVIAVLSGPEPQRTIFENILLKQMNVLGKNAVLVRGLPATTEELISPNKVINHLPSDELNELMSSAKIIVARSGYSTLMDLAALQKKAILVPTPGQTEQEYLAAFAAEKKYAVIAGQEDFHLPGLIKEINSSALSVFPDNNDTLLIGAVLSLL